MNLNDVEPGSKVFWSEFWWLILEPPEGDIVCLARLLDGTVEYVNRAQNEQIFLTDHVIPKGKMVCEPCLSLGGNRHHIDAQFDIRTTNGKQYNACTKCAVRMFEHPELVEFIIRVRGDDG